MKKHIVILLFFFSAFYQLSSQNNSWFTWGDYKSEIEGIWDTNAIYKPQKINQFDSLPEIYTFYEHIYALDKNKRLWAWGLNLLRIRNNNYTRLGISSKNLYVETPEMLKTQQIWKTIASADRFSAAIKDDHTLWVWGLFPAFPSHLGGTEGYESFPVLIDSSRNWKDVKVGTSHILLLKNDNSLWSLGLNNYGVLGIAADGRVDYATKVVKPQLVMKDVKYFETFGSSCYAIDNNDQLYTWGYSNVSITGEIVGEKPNQSDYYLDSTFYTIPHRVNNDGNWKSVKTKNHTIALKNDGSLWSWGSNYYGKLGLGHDSMVKLPCRIGNDFNWKTYSLTFTASFGIKTDGTLWSWGKNDSGQLGLGHGNYTVCNFSPTNITNDSDWHEVHSGGSFSIANKINKKSTSINRNSNICIRIYPNPTFSEFFVKSNSNLPKQPLELVIFDLGGRAIRSLVINDLDTFKYNMKDNVGTGIYFIKISSHEQNFQIIQKVLVN